MMKILSPTILLVLFTPAILTAETFFSINDMTYEGATRFPVGTYGESRMGFTEGTFDVSGDQSSIFIVGHSQHQAIAEFYLPKFSTASSISELPMAENKQPFRKFFDRIPTGNPDNINRITALRLINKKLIVNGVQYYDGEANNTDTTFLIEQPYQLDDSLITGFLKLQAKTHATGWMTPIPAKFEESFKGNFIFGHASNYAINSRNSIGPSAFGVDVDKLMSTEQGGVVSTYPLIDYSIHNPLSLDAYNETGENDLWTEISKAYVGFLVPGSDTYAVFGVSGGHESGIGYKIEQDTGRLCGGPCSYIASDVYNYYWFFDVKDMLNVAEGRMLAHEVRPYEYGEFQVPFQSQGGKPKTIIGANFNHATSSVFFLLGDADTLQSPYEAAPLLLSYTIKIGSRPNAPLSFRIQ